MDRRSPEIMGLYREVAQTFDLRAAQRTKLDNSKYYEPIMNAALLRNWDQVRKLLTEAGIVE